MFQEKILLTLFLFFCLGFNWTISMCSAYNNHWYQNLFGRHGLSCTTFSGGTAVNVKYYTTFQAHKTFNHHVMTWSDENGQTCFKEIDIFSLPEPFCGPKIC